MDEALERLAAEDARKARVVELRFFGGLSMDEVARTLGISLRTAQNDWAFARAWLYQALTAERP
jgi:DNA-directed RNA polymerase specialized sigma24 family protein